MFYVMVRIVLRSLQMKTKTFGFPVNLLMIAAAFLLLNISCGRGVDPSDVDKPTSGRIKVGVDESYRLLIEAQTFVFENMYKKAHLDIMYKPEADVINDFMNDSVPLIIVNRLLSDNQVQYLKERQYIPKVTKIAIDGIALIVNNDNPDTNLFYRTVREIFEGKITRWDQINKTSKAGEIKVVFDHLNSGNPRYFQEKFAIKAFPVNFYAAKSNAEVISLVEKNINYIGVISVNWISDPADSVSNSFLKRFRVAGIAMQGDNDPGTKFYKPYQAYLAEGSYPFTREVYCINRQTYSGLAYGFSSFIAGEKGQRIVLRSGLVPAAMPVRVVELRN